MNFSAVFDYLVGLQRSGFTGEVTFNYYGGVAGDKVKRVVTDSLKTEKGDHREPDAPEA